MPKSVLNSGPRTSTSAPTSGAKREINNRFAQKALSNMTQDADSHETKTHKDWHDRTYLPHWDKEHLIQSITFRLADSLPKHVVDEYLEADDETKKMRIIERGLDQGAGNCWLGDSVIAKTVEDAFLFFDETRYRLLAWVVMRNHVHVVVEQFQGYPLGDVVKSWKNFTARKANKQLNRIGAFWAEDYYDRYIRNVEHLDSVIAYIHENPQKSGLCASAEDWRWSSVRLLRRKPKVRPSADGWF
ncbi:MAG: transposase [Verrucomicrobiota bacterium]